MLKDVGMAVCRQDMLYKDYTSNPIPTSFLIPDMILHAIRLLTIGTHVPEGYCSCSVCLCVCVFVCLCVHSQELIRGLALVEV